MALHYVETDIGTVAVEVEGSGRPIVMLHGSGSSLAAFDAQAKEFRGERQVIRWDAPGYGKSQDPERELTAVEYGQAANCVAKEISPTVDVDLVGVSWGGLVALSALLGAETGFRSVTLVGANFGQQGDAEASARTQARIDGYRASKEDYIAARVDYLSGGDADNAHYRAIGKRMRTTTRLPGFEYALRSMLSCRIADRLADVHIPKFLMWGATDRVAGRQCQRVVDLRLVDSHFVVENAGHLANQDMPDVVNQQLRDFWSTLEA